MTLTGALAEVGIPHSTYRDWLKEPIYFEYLRDEQLMKSYMSNHESKAILMDAINWNKKIPEMERIKIAQSFLKNTDREHNIAITQLNEWEAKKISKPSDTLEKIENLLLDLPQMKNDSNKSE